MAKKTLYISDLDGTLLNPEKELSGYAKRAINELNGHGVPFTVATARSAASVVKILADVSIDVPAVLMNGAVIFDLRTRKYIRKEVIEPATAGCIVDILTEQGIPGFMYAVAGDCLITYYEHLESKAMKDFHDERVQKYCKSFEKVSCFKDKTGENNVIYFSLMDDYEKLQPVRDRFKAIPGIDMAFYRDNYGDGLWYLEIFRATASKYNAVMYLRESGGYDRVVGFGDNHNDIPLLNACDEFYSVSNAVDELKARSTATIGSNLEDAVPAFILKRESIFLEEPV
jgi:Cof subfamily protein (haloacid dehalogenase superfamily)